MPINVDALYFYLPSALHFFKLGTVFPYADPPVAPILYSWSYSTIGAVVPEPFRQIPSLFIISAPLLVFAISRIFFTKKQSLMACVLCIYSPLLDTGTFLWPWHTDFIAGLFAGLAIFFTIKRFKFHEIFAGFCVSLAILTKTPFGLASLIIILVLSINNFKIRFFNLKLRIFAKNKMVLNFKIYVLAYVFLTLLVCFFLFFGIKYSFSIISLITPFIMILFISLGLIIILNFCVSRNNFASKSNLLHFSLALLPTILWVLRQIMLGGSPLALPIFSTSTPDSDWFGVFKSQILNSSPPSLDFTAIFVPFYHQLLFLVILPILIIGLLFVFKEKKAVSLALSGLMFYFLWICSFSQTASFRHLYPLIFLFYPVAIFGFSKICNLLAVKSSSIKFYIIFLLITIMTLQNSSFYLAFQKLDKNQFKQLFSIFGLNSPWTRSEVFSFNFSFLVTILLICSVIFIVPIISKKLSKHKKVSIHRTSVKNIFTLTIIAYYIIFMMIAPMTFKVNSTEGNITDYKINGSWYRSQIELCNDLKEIIDDGKLLTFGFDAFYYLSINDIEYYDLFHGTLATFPITGLELYKDFRVAIEAKDIESIALALTDLDVKYVLLPLPGAYSYEYFERFNQISPLFETLRNRGSMKILKQFSDSRFELWHLNFNETIFTEEIFSDTFDNKTNQWEKIFGNWTIENSTFCGNFTDFGVCVTGECNWTNIIFESDIMGKENVRDTGIIFRYKDPKNYYRVFITGEINKLRVMKMVNGTTIYPEEWTGNVKTQPNVWYNLKVILTNNIFQIYFDEEYVFSVEEDNPFNSGKIGLGGYDEDSCFDNVFVEQIYYKNPIK